MEIQKSFAIDSPSRPEILAPAGGKASFLAAIAAGADAIYCGLKSFSARMAAENFSIDELARLTRLAHDHEKKIYIAVNTIVKSDELDKAGNLLNQINTRVKPDALIVQDLTMLSLARQTKFSGKIHLSTLANITFPDALKLVRQFPKVSRVVLPRELSVDEIKMMAGACPKGLAMEVFIHGALCYAVSGRCYWSSYMGGKSGLRGRCVQPCRRIYAQKNNKRRYFSCQDLSFDVLTKILGQVPQISALKIEGRKKGPHYVYYTVSAYRLLRDHFNDPKAKKTALAYLDYALGRKSTHYNILSQRPQNPVNVELQTGSGMMIGTVKGERSKPYIVPREPLYTRDMLRIGYEDDPWHATFRVGKYVPKKGRLFLKFTSKSKPGKQIPVFLIDRREDALLKQMNQFEKELEKLPHQNTGVSKFKAALPRGGRKKNPFIEMNVGRSWDRLNRNSHDHAGIWLPPDTMKIKISDPRRFWAWLPPVIWPDDQENWKSSILRAIKKGCKNFVLNAPWQIIFFSEIKKLNLWAGPFCNIANLLAIEFIANMGFNGAIVSPELGKHDYTGLPAKSPLLLGVIISGNWPLCVSRTIAEDLTPGTLFNSPKGEQAWAKRYGSDVWVFPNWQIDLTQKQAMLKKHGYSMFVHMSEPLPKGIKLKKRPGLWNWDVGLK
ncbi:MAG: peptidase U32 family protein [Dissulfuribacterales bacterium]